MTPGASRTELRRTPSGLQARVAAPPREGKANRALLVHLAETLGVPVSRVTVVRGAGSRHKIVEVAGMSQEEADERLGLQ